MGAEGEHCDVGSGTTDASAEDSVTKPVGATADSAALDHALLERIHRRAQERLFSAEPVVTRVGRFVVLGQIGEGGMGTVFAAYDEQLDRKVAVKVLREDELPEPDDRLRFEREAKALARISHRNIVTIYEVGESDGALFLAMEHVRGQGLDVWLKSKPAWPEVLEVFTQAGRGLVAAHEAELVHRDFKPANIMLGDDGVVKVLDFGLARVVGGHADADVSQEQGAGATATGLVTSTSTLTLPGMVMGTPPFMSPEQHLGDPSDARTDQYAFCVALWQGLAGQRPFRASTLDEMLQLKLAGAPSWPNDAPSLPRGMVDALRRGLSPEPEDRWPSMAALLDVLAWDPARRRNRRLMAFGGVLLAGAAVAVTQAWTQTSEEQCTGARQQLEGIWDPSRRAQLEAAIVGIDKPYAALVWTRTETELSSYGDAWVAAHTEACQATRRGEQSSRVLDLQMACLRRASRGLEATVDTLADADEAMVRRAHSIVGGLQPLGACADIEALEAEVQPPDPEDAEAVEEASTLLAKAASRRRAARYDEARAAIEDAATLLETTDYGPAQAELAFMRGDVARDEGNYEEAERQFARAVELATRWGPSTLRLDALRSLMFVVGTDLGRPAEALMLRPIVWGESAGDPYEEFVTRDNLGGVYLRLERFAEAEAEFRAALAMEIDEERHGSLGLAPTWNNLGIALLEQKKSDEAEELTRAALQVHERELGPEHPSVGMARQNLGAVLYQLGKHEASLGEMRKALAIYEKSLGPEHDFVASTRQNLGILLHTFGRSDEAVAELRAALAIYEKTLGLEHPEVVMMRGNLAAVLAENGRLEQAEELFRAVIASREKLYGVEDPSGVDPRFRFANVLLERDKPSEALPLAQWLIEHTKGEGFSDSERADAVALLARVLWEVEPPARDRARARSLASDALLTYREAGDSAKEPAAAVQDWLDAHPAP